MGCLVNKLTSILLYILLIFSFNASASIASNVHIDKTKQALFIQAEKLLKKTNSTRYKKLYEQLNGYPLQPYLDQQRLILNMHLSNENEIDQFLIKYRNTPLDWPLRKKWLKYLSKKNRPSLFVKFYKPSSDVSLTCQNLNFLLTEGMPQSVILPQVTKLWLVGKSQHKKCDPLFKVWKKAGYRTNAIIWKRIALAADGGKHTLIPYLTKLLPNNQHYLGELWHKVRRNPSYVAHLKKFRRKSAKEAQIFAYGLKRFIWRSPDKALSTYKKAKKLFKFSKYQQQQITEKFAQVLTNKNHKQANYWLSLLDSKNISESMVQWHLIGILKQQNWQEYITKFSQLPEVFKQKIKWKYWLARAFIITKNKEKGFALLKKLSKERHYYGFLAASYLKTPVSLKNKPLNITLLERSKVLESSAAKRAFEFFYLQRFQKARSEWNFWLKGLSDRDKLVAAKIANENKWFDRAIFTLSKVGYMDDVALRFPKAFNKKIKKHANVEKINPAWAFAITRRESSFMTDAHSPVGARGLMQLMPRTARSLGRGKVSGRYLLNADNNIELGTRYLRKLLDKNKGNEVLATASYNAGPYRIKRWLKNTETLPADIWIETIPYKETRNYVKSVLAYQEIYQNKPNRTSKIFNKIINMTIGG